ncbi:MAG: hypothetical protein Fur0023_22500 [Bacteroidia bacterium]
MPKIWWLCVIINCVHSGLLYAQNPDIKRTWHWYFGVGAGLDFSSGTVVADTNGKLHAKEGCAAISDTSGNLLFYTDGDTIWDRTHNPMPNGTGLASYQCSLDNSSMQGVLIVPNPSDSFQYYVITSDCEENWGQDGYRYSVVDMRLNGGLGDVLSNKKRILLYSPSTEALACTKRTRNSRWLLTHEYNSNVIKEFIIDSTGIHLFDSVRVGYPVKEHIGKLMFSHNKNYLAKTFVYYDTINSITYNELLKFNNSSGKISHFLLLQSYGGSYNVCFSPLDRYIYFTNSGYLLFRYSLCFDDTIQIQRSIDTCFNGNDNSGIIGLEVTPIHTILASGEYHTYLTEIKYPDSNFCIVNYLSLSLNGKYGRQQLPYCSHYYDNDHTCDTNTPKDTFYLNTKEYLQIPNIFTPNGDSVNDYFSIQISGYKGIDYFIYDRWGNLVVQGNKELNPEIKSVEKIWDGKIKNENANTGIYYYLIKITTTNNRTETRKGFIQLLK